MERLNCITLITVLSLLHQARLSVKHTCIAPDFYMHENSTLCAATDPSTVFREYGYNDPEDNIPDDLSSFNPPLLYEGDILYEVHNEKQFRIIGNGTYASLYLAELRNLRKRVVLKIFAPNFQDYEATDMEYRIHKYLEHTGHVPEIFGILTYGPDVNHAALVIEYLQNSLSLEDLLNLDEMKTFDCFWFYVCLQTAQILRSFHRKYVIHNDLHLNNIMIQWRETSVKIFIIDFGDASFRSGLHDLYLNFDLKDIKHLPQETLYEVTTPASDIYALGLILKRVGANINSSLYSDLAEQCMEKDKQLRPKLDDIIRKLQMFGSKCSEMSSIPLFVPNVIREHDLLSNLTPTYIPVYYLKEISGGNKEPLEKQVNMLIVEKNLFNETVFLKCVIDSSFEFTRVEALYHMYLQGTGYVLELKGITTFGSELCKTALVVRSFAEGHTLMDILNFRQSNPLYFKLAIALEVSKAVKLIHKKNVIINNLKWDNILIETINGKPEIKIFHLAAASFVGIHVTQNDISDAPEVVDGHVTSFASDVYSLGVVMKKLFDEIDIQPNDMKSLIQNCMVTKPVERPTASQVVDSISQIIMLRGYPYVINNLI